MSNPAIPKGYERHLDVPGIVADPPDGVEDNEEFAYLTRHRVIALFSHREKFFDAVPSFKPLRRSSIQALKALADKGIIGLGDVPPKKAKCRACGLKAMVAVFMQMLRHTQTLVSYWQKNGNLGRVGDELRAYIGDKRNRRLVIYLRGRSNNVERVEF